MKTKMIKCSILLLFLSVIVSNIQAQIITHGPFIGAVTENSARMYIRTSIAASLDIVVSTDSLFSGQMTFNGTTVAADDSVGIIDLSGLQADTKYFYKAVISGSDTSNVQSFMTFPVVGTSANFHFAFGSCQGFDTVPPTNEDIFDIIVADKPRFFLQCGDWGYPDTTDNLPIDSNFFAGNFQNIIETYHARYSGAQIKNMMTQVPVDYVYDDHDYVNNNSSRTSASLSTDGLPFREYQFPPSTRRNSIDAYYRFFPHYTLPDTSEGIYHSFRYGNIEVFMCDDRSARSPTLEALQDSGGTLYFNPPAGHSMLGQQQLQWLLNGLQNSTATWKFIITGVAFNKGYRDMISAFSGNNTIQQTIIPGLGTGKSAFAGIMDTWSAYPDEQDALINFCAQNNIKNVIWLSSDSHTSAIDDGTNAGFPEIMAGNLAKDNSQLAWLMANASLLPGVNQDFNVWNAGGQGLGNSNYENAYGRIYVYGDDSVNLSIIGISDTVIADLMIYSDTTAISSIARNRGFPGNYFELYPNPITDRLNIHLNNKEIIDANTQVIIADILGRKLMELPSRLHLNSIQTVNISKLNNGMYFLVLHTQKGNYTKSFHKQ